MDALKNQHSSTKQFVYFANPDELKSCKADIIPILLLPSSYIAHNLNFINCFLNNTPPKQQTFCLHWSPQRIHSKAFSQDVLEISTTYFTQSGEEHTKNYFMPVPMLFSMLNISIPYGSILRNDDLPKDSSTTARDLASERAELYNKVLGEYCATHKIAFHKLQHLRKKDVAYIRAMRKL